MDTIFKDKTSEHNFWLWMDENKYCTYYIYTDGTKEVCFFDSGKYVPIEEVGFKIIFIYLCEYLGRRIDKDLFQEITGFEMSDL